MGRCSTCECGRDVSLMAYEAFSYYYDILMQDVPYHKWIAKTKQYLPHGSSILDVGCGTGTISILLANEGYKVTGIDLSEEMLSLAYEKTLAEGLGIQYVQQDMSRLEGFSGFDGAVIYVDSLMFTRYLR